MQKLIQLRITKEVIFTDQDGRVVRVYRIGDIIYASGDAGHYWIHSMGGIFKNEAVLVESDG